MKIYRTSDYSFSKKLGNGHPRIFAGVLNGATRDVDDGQFQKGVKVAPYAAVHEFGGGNVPPRPFLRTTKSEKHKEWSDVLAVRIKARGGDLKKAMNDLLSLIRGDIVTTIKSHAWTPLKATTIEAKKRKGRPEPARPLVDTASLIKSISAEVRG